MKDLLEAYFGKHYKSTRSVSAVSEVVSGEFSFCDSKACSDCGIHTPQVERNCDKVVLRCSSAKQMVEAIDLERFIDKYSNLKAIPSGKKCDLLLSDDQKIVFCDLSCSQAKYIDPFRMADVTEKIGKRNTVRGQIANSISLLSKVPEIADAMNERLSKIALFAYREKPAKEMDIFDSDVTAKMKALDIIGSTLSKTPMYSDMGNGFVFTEVKYPDVYLW